MSEAQLPPEDWTPEDFEKCRRRALRARPADSNKMQDWLRAKMDLVWAYRNGYGTEPDTHRYFELLAQVAELEVGSEMGARYHLAFAFKDGIGTKPNANLYLKWMRRAAESGDREAMFKLAEAYQYGYGAKADERKYFHWIKKMAERNSPFAVIRLAEAYRTGIGTDIDKKRHFEETKRAVRLAKDALKEDNKDIDLASEDLPLAIQMLSRAYRDGIGVRTSKPMYFKKLQSSVEAASQAIHELDKDEEEQRSDLKRTLAPLKRELAVAYRKGIGTQRDDQEAFNYMYSAAKDGDDVAMLKLGEYYEAGIGRKKNIASSHKWFKKAAELGNADAMYKAAILHGTRAASTENKRKFRQLANDAVWAGQEEAFVLNGLAELHGEGLLSPKRVANLIKLIDSFRDEVQRIKCSHVLSPKDSKAGVAHFTSIEALYSMLPAANDGNTDLSRRERNCLRLYNISYVNDPHEGMGLLESATSAEQPLAKLLQSIPRNDKKIDPSDSLDSLPLRGLAFSVYVGSFTLRADRLDLWRAYGRDGHGYCLVTPNSVFQDPTTLTEYGFAGLVAIDQDDRKVPMSLYRIAYGTEAVVKAVDQLQPSLQKLISSIEAYSQGRENGGKIKTKLYPTIREILSDILYLYKNEEYRSEEEVRMLAPYALSTQAVRADDRVPGRLYVETVPFLFSPGSKIIIGPKVQNPEIVRLELKHRLDRNGHRDVDVAFSQIPYR